MSNIVGNSHIQKVYFHAILADPATYMNATYPSFFDDKSVGHAFNTVKEFYEKYHQIPSLDQTVEISKLENSDGITPDGIRSLWDLNITEFDKEWLKESVECFIDYKSLYRNLGNAVQYVKGSTIGSHNIKEITAKVKSMLGQEGVTYDQDEGLDFYDPSSHVQTDKLLNSTGYPFFDIAGGNEKKTLKVFVGPPKSGKCFSINTLISVRNKRTGELINMTVGELHKRIQDSQTPSKDITYFD